MAFTQRKILESLSASRSSIILDWGCGKGEQIDALNLFGYRNVSGLDVDSSFSRDDISIDKDSIGWLERHPERWDVILARESIYYIPKREQQRLWSAFNSALKPGGKLVVIAFNGALSSSEWIRQKDLGIEMIFNEITLRDHAESAYFCEIQVSEIHLNHRTPLGHIFFICLTLYRNLSNRIRYIAERGIDKNNPRLFSKSIILEARKKSD